MTNADAIRLRTARLDDIPRLIDVQRRASLIWETYREALTAHPEVIEVPVEQVRSGSVRVVTDEHDIPIGFSAVIDRGDAVELDGLFVAPECMRHGLGGALVADVVTRAGAAGARRISVVANPGAVPFYTRHGFRQTGATETRFGPAPRFTLELGGDAGG
jgi:GNAT superfamily N-acetyltransferase